MFDELRELFNDKKTFRIFIVLWIIAIIIILFFIFKPSAKTPEYAKYTEVNLEEKNKEMGKSYFDSILFNLRYNQKDKLKDLVSENYMKYTNKSNTEVINEVLSKGIVKLQGMEIITYGTYVVYTTNIVYSDNSTREINVIEYLPYCYKISFDGVIDYSKINRKVAASEGISMKINAINVGTTGIIYNLSITNESNERISIDTSASKSIYLNLTNGEKYYLSSMSIDNDLVNMKKGSTVSKSLHFEIPLSVQSSISSLVFSNVKVDGKTKDISFAV